MRSYLGSAPYGKRLDPSAARRARSAEESSVVKAGADGGAASRGAHGAPLVAHPNGERRSRAEQRHGSWSSRQDSATVRRVPRKLPSAGHLIQPPARRRAPGRVGRGVSHRPVLSQRVLSNPHVRSLVCSSGTAVNSFVDRTSRAVITAKRAVRAVARAGQNRSPEQSRRHDWERSQFSCITEFPCRARCCQPSGA